MQGSWNRVPQFLIPIYVISCFCDSEVSFAMGTRVVQLKAYVCTLFKLQLSDQ